MSIDVFFAFRTEVGPGGSEPTILIVEAGLGGVMLGTLLERADIPYLIMERATTAKLLGNEAKKTNLSISSFFTFTLSLSQLPSPLSLNGCIRCRAQPDRGHEPGWF